MVQINTFGKKLISIIVVSILISFCVFSFGEDEHSNHLCYTIFGYVDDNAIQQAFNPNRIPDYDKTSGGRSLRAYYIVKDAVAVAIDNVGTSSRSSYTNIKQRLSFTPSVEDLKVYSNRHREACHQGFDFEYKSSMRKRNWDRLNRRWIGVGRTFLIKAIKNAFSTDENTAIFIAMIAYYTHLIGDLAEGETDSMLDLANFSNMAEEIIEKVELYGNKLNNNQTIPLLVNKIKVVKTSFVSGDVQGSLNRDFYAKKLLDALAEYVPDIISENVLNPIFLFNTKSSPEKFELR